MKMGLLITNTGIQVMLCGVWLHFLANRILVAPRNEVCKFTQVLTTKCISFYDSTQPYRLLGKIAIPSIN